ncbi:sugar-transfer associated ATP-grasp domain-containing protein [Sphingomonas arenae]|uniref:sugar-transfer associated ATP-grasp domain-containing protein n=1 Tax=Sphingomonas arenae TaxID=2812555 RepID=UPI001967472D|nr:sugar-transfer associated ATP-grasp domain-containing protein [Sphingomonas arenae]
METTQAEEALRRYFAAHVLSARSPRAWYLRVFPGVVRQTAIYGRHAAWTSGRSFTAVLLDCLRTCVEQVYWPAGYYRFKLYLPERAALARRFLSSRLLKPILLAANDGKEMLILDDKVRFADACRRAGLPHVNTVALFENGRAVGGPLETSLPRANLFVKSTNLLCGRGAELWVFDERTETYRSDGRQLTAGQLVQHVATLSAEGVTLPLWKRLAARIPRLMVQGERALQEPRPHVIQRELRNHPQVERFSNGALCTVRIVTARSVVGPPEIITAALRMATGSSHVDNFAAGGLAAPIDLHTGVLGRAVYKDIRKADLDTHPDSGAPITGERLPFWEEARSLALKVHEAFPKSAAIGWDIALTDQGPLLLEANPNWCAEVVQMAHGGPLGATALPKLLLSHLEQHEPISDAATPVS